MPMHWLVNEEDGSVLVLADGWEGNGYTLCGIATEGDEEGPLQSDNACGGYSAAESTNRRITCPQCIAAIDHCKQIKAREINREALGGGDE